MTLTAHAPRMPPAGTARTHADRFRLSRAGILNVWQYDEQVFEPADGRMLLRGANGAGKSKTLEMLLPFVIDGDKSRITASGRHHTSLLWLMTDGYDGQARVGYLWVEFRRPGADGDERFSCGVGIRSSASGQTATAWYFATSQRIGEDLVLEDDGGPLSRPRLEEAVGEHGRVFEKPSEYKEHIGLHLFGLRLAQYDEVLRLLYWLRQPQVGEDIEPSRLADQLSQALPPLDEHAVKATGDTFDELAAYGEQIARRDAAANAVRSLAAAYAGYARGVVAIRARAVLEALRVERQAQRAVRERTAECQEVASALQRLTSDRDAAQNDVDVARGRIAELEASPEARDQRRLGELEERAEERESHASGAEQRAARAEEDRRRACEREDGSTRSVLGGAATLGSSLGDLDHRQSHDEVGSPLSVPPVLDRRGLDESAGPTLDTALATVDDELAKADGAVGRRRAAVTVVRESLRRLDQADREARAQEERAEEAEVAWEAARRRRTSSEAVADARAVELEAELRAWAASEVAPSPLTPPGELTPQSVDGLAGLARSAARTPLGDLRDQSQRAGARVARSREEIENLLERRRVVEAEVAPRPADPTLPRSERPDGAALWQVIDFRDHVTGPDRAGLEAALQASGLLDAWVRPDGLVLDGSHLDTLLLPRNPVASEAGPSLRDVLCPDLAAGGDLDAPTVERVLSGISLLHDADRVDETGTAALGVDGSWRLSALRGRATKERAQYVGATARAAERARRLAELDELLGRERAEARSAADALDEADAAARALEAWVAALPDSRPLQLAWGEVDVRSEEEHRAEALNRSAQERAHRARRHAAELGEEVERLASTYDLPADVERLAALDQRLTRLAVDLERARDQARALGAAVTAWTRDRRDVRRARDVAEQAVVEAREARSVADRVRAQAEELRAAVGASITELQDRLAALRRAEASARRRLGETQQGLQDTSKREGLLLEQARHAAVDLESTQSAAGDVLAEFSALAEVPGLVGSAFADSTADAAAVPEASRLTAAARLGPGDPVPTPTMDAVRRCAALAQDEPRADANSVWKAYTDAASGPAADHTPTVSEFGDLLAVTGTDDAGEHPVGTLADRATRAVEADRELLTTREREQFEQHVLGELGDAIRRSRLEAEELVEEMNRLLGGVSTSQGIRVRLQWRLRDEVPPEARDAVRLLGQPVGALLPEERAGLRDALHRLIEASRVERPELSYSEHLEAALDYRAWFGFRIRYTRPETPGSWQDLHRRSALSQGEQKVLCYLPLFAAAAAHFSSLAGAAPYAPRLVLLDDAFPKIDVRTHPLLFGLLVDLDLDFVITSERLWGDHDTVPSLAIYEALRDPAQRGIAQFHYRWDGRRLHSIG